MLWNIIFVVPVERSRWLAFTCQEVFRYASGLHPRQVSWFLHHIGTLDGDILCICTLEMADVFRNNALRVVVSTYTSCKTQNLVANLPFAYIGPEFSDMTRKFYT